MYNSKFSKGDIVKVVKGKYLGKIGKIIDISHLTVQDNGKTRSGYTVKFLDGNDRTYYSYELDKPEYGEYLDYLDAKAKVEPIKFPTIDAPRFKVGDIVKVIMSKEIPNLGKVTNDLGNNRFEVQYAGNDKEFFVYFDYQLTKANPNDESFYYEYLELAKMANDIGPEEEQPEEDIPCKEETKYCKYCKEAIDNEEYFESEEESGVCEWCAKYRKKMPKIHMRKSVAVDLKDFSIYGKDGDWLEVTEWTNGEGIDIDIHYNSDHEEDIRNFKLSYDELGIIMNIVNKFGYLPTIYTDEEK